MQQQKWTPYKIIRVYIVHAETKKDARKQFEEMTAVNREGEFLEYEGYPKEVDDNQGFLANLRKQLTGK